MRAAVIHGRVVAPASIAPYIELVVDRAHQELSSVYRGEDQKPLLHRLGLHTQAEIHHLYPAISNPPGHSEHELRSDGHANPHVPDGGLLQEWQVGVDSGTDSDADKHAIEQAAAHFGWRVRHPYPRGVEGHHWCFSVQPHPNGIVSAARISAIRARQVLAAQLLLHPAVSNPFGRRISAAGVELVAGFEGFRSRPYRDAVGVWTIGYGHTRGVTGASRAISASQGRALLQRDLNAIYAPAVNRALKLVGFKATQHEFDALVSFAFNLGPGLLTGDHDIARALRSHKRGVIANAILEYDKAGQPPRPLAGLTRRRESERALFLKG